MPQMPESFKPIDMPDSFKPIDSGVTEQPGLLSRTWNAANEPLVDIRTGTLKTASDEFAAKHPIIGGGLNLLTDSLSSLTSPLNLGLSSATLGSGTAAKLGLTKTAELLEAPAKIAAAGMVGHGGYNLVRPEATVPERVGGLVEGSLGALGLKSSLKPKLEIKPQIKPEITEVPKVDVAQLPDQELMRQVINPKPQLPIDVGTNPKPVETKLLDLIDASKPLNTKQKELYRTERAAKFGEASTVQFNDPSDMGKFFGALKGEHSKVQIEPLSDSLSHDEIWELQQKIGKSPLTTTEKANAFTGLTSLLEGRVPVDSNILQLEKVFGDEFGERTRSLVTVTPRRAITEIGGGMKSLMSAADFGFPFRQGINYAGRKEWRGIFKPMVESYMSEGRYKDIMDSLESTMKHKELKSNLAITDLRGLTNREETAMSTWAERVPVLGNLARRSNRAYTVAANKLRNDVFDTMYDDYKRLYDSRKILAGSDPEAIKLAEMLNPDNKYIADKMADQINTATGRGALPGNLEKIAPELNATFFAPRLISARVRSLNRILNPASYWSYNPIERKEALKQLVSIVGTAITTATLAKLGGADVSLDPDGSDFAKIKFGNTRIDPLGGYQQYFVPVAKLLLGTATSPKSGKQYQLGGNAVLPNRWDVIENAALNKLSPVAGLGVAIMKGREQSGQPTDFTTLNPMENSATKRFLPMITQDMYDILQDDPKLLPALIPGSLGMGVQDFQ